jgi:hypothetical protein
LALGLLSLFAVSVIIPGGRHAPGRYRPGHARPVGHPETVAAFRAQLGLDLPPLQRFVQWAWRLLHGDLGVSLANQRPIAELVGRAWATPSAWRCWRRCVGADRVAAGHARGVVPQQLVRPFAQHLVR